MSRLEEIKKELTEFDKGNFNDSDWIIINKYIDVFCEIYATECVKASLEKASEDAKIIHKDLGWYNKSCVKKESITNPDNIVLL